MSDGYGYDELEFDCVEYDDLDHQSEVHTRFKIRFTDPHDLLHCPMVQPNDGDAATVGEFLGLLLSTLWLQGEGFSGKRPLGNSDWQQQVYMSMVEGGFADRIINRWGDEDIDDPIAADELILMAIRLAYDHGAGHEQH